VRRERLEPRNGQRLPNLAQRSRQRAEQRGRIAARAHDHRERADGDLLGRVVHHRRRLLIERRDLRVCHDTDHFFPAVGHGLCADSAADRVAAEERSRGRLVQKNHGR
jgi:hypothetical protein